MPEPQQFLKAAEGALMLGWTALLFWAQLKPIERADILLNSEYGIFYDIKYRRA